MNYLTNYYKNLCEQLQEQISLLEARINRPTHTVLGDTFRNDQEMDRRVGQRMDVMSDLDLLAGFEEADEATRNAAKNVLKDMKDTNQIAGRVGTNATTADLRAAMGGLKKHAQSPSFQTQKGKRLSGMEDRGFKFTPAVNDWVGGNRYMDTQRGEGFDTVSDILGDLEDFDTSRPVSRKFRRDVALGLGRAMNPTGVSRMQVDTQNVARADASDPRGYSITQEPVMGMKVEPSTGSPSEFKRRLGEPEVAEKLKMVAPWINASASEVQKRFPSYYESGVLGRYWTGR